MSQDNYYKLCDNINKQYIIEQQKQLFFHQINQLRTNNYQLVQEIKDLQNVAFEYNQHLQTKDTEITQLKLIINQQKQLIRKTEDTIQRYNNQNNKFQILCTIFLKKKKLLLNQVNISKNQNLKNSNQTYNFKKVEIMSISKSILFFYKLFRQQINSLLLNSTQTNLQDIIIQIENEQNKHLQLEIQLLQKSQDQLLLEQEQSELKENQKIEKFKNDSLQFKQNLVELQFLKDSLNRNTQEMLYQDELIKKSQLTISYLEKNISNLKNKYAQFQKNLITQNIRFNAFVRK
ncbi:unnamed protein product [Paramecium sonneborni]|uniref:Uncharacterized protein n=1 Tax=Paramecium sonneborni TaxID=65129 RepID=A0A8S1NXS3_9CILI|nr:unnamed protein product [Paramecium sonneborni]